MPSVSRFPQGLILALLLIMVARSQAHLPIATNLTVDIELDGTLLALEPWVPTFLLPPLEDITFEEPDNWPTGDQRSAQIEAYFDEVCPVEIDGVRIIPTLQSLRLQPMEQAKHLGEITNFVEARIVLHYRCDQAPEKMKLRWGIYVPVPDGGWGALAAPDQDPQELDLMMFIDKKEDFIYFSPQEPEFYWHRKPQEVNKLNVIAAAENVAAADTTAAAREPRRFPLGAVIAAFGGVAFFIAGGMAKAKLPIRVAGLATAGVLAILMRDQWPIDLPGESSAPLRAIGITEPQAVETFKALQANLYSAFDYETEDQVYAVLSQSVDGALLDDIYTEVYRSLIVVDKGSAVCKVQKVEVLECSGTAVDPAADGKSERFDIACHWRVHGIVQHYEHIHRRINEYRADYRLSRKDDSWKITGVAVADQQRLDPKTLKPSEDF